MANSWTWRLCLIAFGLSTLTSADAGDETWEVQLQFGRDDEERGQYAEAEKHFRAAIEAARSLGDQDPRLAECYRSLAFNLLSLQGRSAEAESPAKKALDIQEKARGSEDPSIAPFLATLAVTYTYLGRPAEAETLYRRALSIWKKALGPDHPEIASTLANIARCCLDRGKLDSAEPLLTEALAIQSAGGRETRAMATSLYSLARMRFMQGQYTEAETSLKRCLSVRERVLGPDHHEVSETLNAFYALYEKQGKFAEGEPYMRRALTITEKSLGANHPDLGMVLYNHGCLCQRLARNAEAEADYRRALAIWENYIQNPGYSQSAIWCLQNCAMVLRENGKADEAATMDARATELLAKRGRPEDR